mgnify:CR=1 FL=1
MGNPNIYKHGFKSSRKESLTSALQVKVPKSLLEKIKQQENWQEFVRQTLEKAVKSA